MDYEKEIFALLLSVFMPICVMLSTCSFRSYDVYYSDVPLDITYSATLSNYLEVQSTAHPDFKESTTTLFAVSQKYETVRISNDKYNVVLKYDYDTHLGSREIQNATFNPDSTSVPHLTNDGTTNGAPTGNIPHLATITQAMLETE